jgi:hypothetical protein
LLLGSSRQRAHDAAGLELGELHGEIVALRRGEEQALAPVGGARAALDELLLDQLLEDPVEALLGDPQDVEELRDGEARLRSTKCSTRWCARPKPYSSRIRSGSLTKSR